MKEIKNKKAIFEEPILEVIHLTEKDIITASGGGLDDENPIEGEMIPVSNYNYGEVNQ